MIGISRRADYGVRAMLYLAENGGSSSRKIAKAQHIPEKFLPHIFIDLGKSGLVSASRGSSGGVRLAKAAGEITLHDILEAVEGRVALNECLLNPKFCCRAPRCPVRKVWARAQAGLVHVLKKTTLQKIAAQKGG